MAFNFLQCNGSLDRFYTFAFIELMERHYRVFTGILKAGIIDGDVV